VWVSFLVLFALTRIIKEKSTPMKSRSVPAGGFFCCFALTPFLTKKSRTIFPFACKILLNIHF